MVPIRLTDRKGNPKDFYPWRRFTAAVILGSWSVRKNVIHLLWPQFRIFIGDLMPQYQLIAQSHEQFQSPSPSSLSQCSTKVVSCASKKCSAIDVFVVVTQAQTFPKNNIYFLRPICWLEYVVGQFIGHIWSVVGRRSVSI